jgi:hypothetical protein
MEQSSRESKEALTADRGLAASAWHSLRAHIDALRDRADADCTSS